MNKQVFCVMVCGRVQALEAWRTKSCIDGIVAVLSFIFDENTRLETAGDSLDVAASSSWRAC